MPTLIDKTYFDTGLTFIPQLDLVYNANRVNKLIAAKEPEYLNRVLGIQLASAFKLGLEADPVEARWAALRDGANFEYKGYLRRWAGFVNEPKESPIAEYVYYWHMRKQASPSTGSGNIIQRAENAERVSYMRDMVQVWNDMVTENIVLMEYLTANRNLYPEWEGNRIPGDCLDWLARRGCCGWPIAGRPVSIDVDVFTPVNHLNL